MPALKTTAAIFVIATALAAAACSRAGFSVGAAGRADGAGACKAPLGYVCSADCWCRPPEPPVTANLYALWGTSHADMYAAGAAGTLLHFDGQRWEALDSGVDVELRSLWGAPGGPVYAVGAQGVILARTDSGWAQESSGVTDDLRGVWGDGGVVIAVGWGGSVLGRDSGTWRQEPVVSTHRINFEAVYGGSPAGFYAVADAGSVFRRVGQQWEGVPTTCRSKLMDIWGLGSILYSAGVLCNILVIQHSSAYLMDIDPGRPKNALWGEGEILYAVGPGGAVVQVLIPQETYVEQESGTTEELWAVFGAGDGVVYAAGEGGVILRKEL